MRINIAFPVLDEEKRLEKGIKATLKFLDQHHIEYCVLTIVDNGSTDGSREKIAAWSRKDGRIRLIAKEENGGAALARNTGIDHAAGRYVAFLDADDIWIEDKLEKELRFMEEKNAAFAFTAYEFGDEQAHGTGKVVNVPETLSYREALSRTVIFTTTVMFDLTKIGKETVKMPNVPSEDTATWWKVLRKGYTAYGLNEVLTIYRRPARSLSSNKCKAVARIWNLYRKEEKLSVPYSLWNFAGWAWRAVCRRI